MAITLNTDNPTASATTLTAEHTAAHQAGLTGQDLARAAEHSYHLAFLPDTDRTELAERRRARRGP